MNRDTLDPREELVLIYEGPRNGLVEFIVVADRPVDTFVLDSDETGDENFETRSLGGFRKRQLHRQELRLPRSDKWSLVIVSCSDEGVTSVEYQVRF